MMRFLVLFGLVVLPAMAEERTEFQVADNTPREGQFELEDDLLNKIYRESVTSAGVDTNPISRGILVAPQLTFLNATELTLSNNYFTVPYTASGNGGFPMFGLTASGNVAQLGPVEVSLSGRLAYSYKEAVIEAQSPSGSGVKSLLKLHWIPISAGVNLTGNVFGTQAIKPYVFGSVGAQWLYQQGALDGVEQGFWVPFLRAGGGLTLFDSIRRTGDWFGGLQIGASTQNSFGSTQTVKGWSLDLGMTLLL